MVTIPITAGDTRPNVDVILRDGDGNFLPLDDADVVTFRMAKRNGQVYETAIDKQAEIVDPETSQVRYAWRRGETSEPGVYLAAFRIRYDDGSQLTAPTNGWITINIRRAL